MQIASYACACVRAHTHVYIHRESVCVCARARAIYFTVRLTYLVVPGDHANSSPE